MPPFLDGIILHAENPKDNPKLLEITKCVQLKDLKKSIYRNHFYNKEIPEKK